MNKTKFFKACDSCDQKHAHQLSVAGGREYRGMDNIIDLTGSTWAAGGLTTWEIYRPTPGRQANGPKPYQAANEMIAKKLAIYSRWLAEWKLMRGVSKS